MDGSEASPDSAERAASSTWIPRLEAPWRQIHEPSGAGERVTGGRTETERGGREGRLLEQVLEAVHGFPGPGWRARDGEAGKQRGSRPVEISRVTRREETKRDGDELVVAEVDDGRGEGEGEGRRDRGRAGKRGVGGASAWRGLGLLSP